MRVIGGTFAAIGVVVLLVLAKEAWRDELEGKE
jgi:hypothetical protein